MNVRLMWKAWLVCWEQQVSTSYSDLVHFITQVARRHAFLQHEIGEAELGGVLRAIETRCLGRIILDGFTFVCLYQSNQNGSSSGQCKSPELSLCIVMTEIPISVADELVAETDSVPSTQQEEVSKATLRQKC